MRNPTGELAHSLHLLCLQECCLGLLTRSDLGPEQLVGGSQFLSAFFDRALELFPAARERCGSGVQRIGDLIQFAHSAGQSIGGRAAP